MNIISYELARCLDLRQTRVNTEKIAVGKAPKFDLKVERC